MPRVARIAAVLAISMVAELPAWLPGSRPAVQKRARAAPRSYAGPNGPAFWGARLNLKQL